MIVPFNILIHGWFFDTRDEHPVAHAVKRTPYFKSSGTRLSDASVARRALNSQANGHKRPQAAAKAQSCTDARFISVQRVPLHANAPAETARSDCLTDRRAEFANRLPL